MKIAVSYLTDDPKTDFIPDHVFDVKPNEDGIWMEVEHKKCPPLLFTKLLSPSFHLGIDAQFIEMDVVIGRYYPRIGDILTIKGYDMLIQEIG